ncbi:MAG: hypothetical protein FD139_2762 [Methylocystaceae bacterium]|nr:MAG: hypothetical protein FD148_118 [Methylocystaceae bacterium]TXT43680.1 MAG: hypothetical protein FD139_2762 [Methylocystaceae bacterium]
MFGIGGAEVGFVTLRDSGKLSGTERGYPILRSARST